MAVPPIFTPEEGKKQFSKCYSVRNASRLVIFGKPARQNDGYAWLVKFGKPARQNDGYAWLVRAFLIIMARGVSEGGEVFGPHGRYSPRGRQTGSLKR